MGMITNIQRCCVHDGPGVRTTVFFKGCPMRCFWCHNPETQLGVPQIEYQSTRCISCGACVSLCACHTLTREGTHRYNAHSCRNCLRCSYSCPTGAITVTGREMSVSQVLNEVLKDRAFYQSQGGMTLSGGEPLLQSQFALELLGAAKQAGIHTCVETCGSFDPSVIPQLAQVCDLVLFDVKDTDPQRHQQNTGGDLLGILSNLRQLDRAGVACEVRGIILRGINDHEEHVRTLGAIGRSLAHCRKVTIFPYHPLGNAKLEWVGRPPLQKDYTPSPQQMQRLAELLRQSVQGD